MSHETDVKLVSRASAIPFHGNVHSTTFFVQQAPAQLQNSLTPVSGDRIALFHPGGHKPTANYGFGRTNYRLALSPPYHTTAVEFRYAILQSTSFSVYRRCTQLGIPVVITRGPLGIWLAVRVVRQATGSKVVSPVDVAVVTRESRVLAKSPSDPRLTTMTCQASTLRLRKKCGNLKN